MKKLFWILTVALLAFTACHTEAPDNDPVGIAMIVKNGQIDYFRQIETSFREVCQEKGLEAYYHFTSADNAYQDQLTAVTELRKLGKSALKGIIFTPSYGINGENAEAEVAALAAERGIPVIILDSPVSKNGPLASCPYIGTDNTAAGEAMAKLVSADNVAAFALINGPGIARATAFKALKPDTEVFRVSDNCNDEVQAALDKYDDFVFFNGNDLVDVLPMLKAAGKRVYTFDVYGEFLDELIAGSLCLRGVMAQNTFAMARKAVEAVLAANGKPGEMVPTFYLTTSTLDAEEAQPFLKFYGKQVPDLKVAEKIIGKWVFAERDGEPTPTDKKRVFTFVSDTKAYVSVSRNSETEAGTKWLNHEEADVAISGNKVTVTMHPDEHTTIVNKFTVTAINDKAMAACANLIVTVDGIVERDVENNLGLDKVDEDYSEAILGTWQGRCTSEGSAFDDGKEHRWEYKEDGTFVYYRKDYNIWKRVNNSLNEYFVDGNLLCTRWIDDGVEYREWWEISIDGDTMSWTALRQNDDGTTFDVTFQMSKVSADNVRLTQTYGVIAFSSGKPMSSITADHVWEDGLLRSSHTSTLMHMSGKVSELDDTYVYDDDGNCIELHHVSGQTATSNTDAYFTYDEQGRMTGAVEKNGDSEITVQTTITAYTDDDYIQALTVEHFNSGTVAEYQFIWENGDLTGYTRHFSVPDDKEDITVTFEYDDYLNYKAGIPISSAVFDPEMIADRGSAHNRRILDDEYSYSNGRLVKTSSPASSALITTTYLTYSDGTTGKDN